MPDGRETLYVIAACMLGIAVLGGHLAPALVCAAILLGVRICDWMGWDIR